MRGTRRRFLRAAAAASGAFVAACRGRAPDPQPQPSMLGAPVSRYGERSPFETARRMLSETATLEEASSRTPLGGLDGAITPSSLHFERHHAGVPRIDPSAHTLLIHGLVERPLVFTIGELRRLPSVTRISFLECSGNSGPAWYGAPAPTAQALHGLTSCSEWTGVPLALLLRETGVLERGTWFVAEGADACRMVRSAPIEKALDDALVVYAQNGEALRPEQGYPLRLLLPGWEGMANVKWLKRIKVVDQPYMTRDETSKYTDLLPDGRARQFTFVIDAKSVITRPSGGQTLPGPGFFEISGLAWSGRGAIARVEVSTDGGSSWADATLQSPVLAKAHTRFTFPWHWGGTEAVIAARCTDGTGYVQPTRSELIAARGVHSTYHYNGIQGWRVRPDGSVVDAVF
jgi:sulfane dehydrogenase subunit SoxC